MYWVSYKTSILFVGVSVYINIGYLGRFGDRKLFAGSCSSHTCGKKIESV